MRIAKDFLREAIQLVNTRRLLIEFKVEKGVADKKLGESRTYKLCTQPTEEKSPMKQVLKGQILTDMDALYTLVKDILRGNVLTVVNNKQVMFDKESLENLEHCLNAVTVQIARVIKLNNYLMEFPMPTGIVAKKLEDEEILE
eukprot:7283375-Ditylum_brightwellii.AAC.1